MGPLMPYASPLAVSAATYWAKNASSWDSIGMRIVSFDIVCTLLVATPRLVCPGGRRVVSGTPQTSERSPVKDRPAAPNPSTSFVPATSSDVPVADLLWLVPARADISECTAAA
ncbi:hypothetical protein GCM10011492_40010 [Flexivirga endophytica]|uniref:Uncharacterized protein n=1 Tax=Flexivirga endophytica TaxID=1849103 RepID=A0A916THB1_9MICO|nr:hypothetical protein GCM10011492_40010 [Flexivirga endophytica]GHB68802.1 hypothetical protein GCM10008112_41910 [Flexivirga endophytica]